MKRKTIGVDLDDVLFDFNRTFIAHHNTTYGTNHTRADQKSWDYEKNWGISTEELLKKIHNFHGTKEHRDAPPIPGAVEAVRELAKNNTLYIVTAKPESVKEDVSTWVEKHFPGLFKGIEFTRKKVGEQSKKKSEICKELGIEIFIDDALHNAENIAESGIPVLLLDTPWNQGPVPPLITRVHSWEEIVKKLS